MSETREWVNVYGDGSVGDIFQSRDMADVHSRNAVGRRAAVRCDEYLLDDGKLQWVASHPYDPPPAEAPSEPSVEEERWAFTSRVDGTAVVCRHGWKPNNHQDKLVFPVIVRSKAADDELKAELEAARSCLATVRTNATTQVSTLTRERDEARELADADLSKDASVLRAQVAALTRECERKTKELDSSNSAEKELLNMCIERDRSIATLTAERDDLSRKLAVAEREMTLVRQERDEQDAKFARVATERDRHAAGLAQTQRKLAELTSERETLESQ